MVSVIDLTQPDPRDFKPPETISLLSSSSSEDELSILLDPLAPVLKESSSESEFDDDSSIGIGNSYGEFYPLYDLKKSIARFGYIDYLSTEPDCKPTHDDLSCDSWYIDHCWWLKEPFASLPKRISTYSSCQEIGWRSERSNLVQQCS